MSFARFLVAPTVAAAGLAASSSMRPRTLRCDAPSLSLPRSATTTKPLIDPHQFATGSVLGIAAGLIFKRLGKLFFVVIGGAYLVLRALGTSSSVPGLGGIRVPWQQAKQFVLNRTRAGDAATRVGEAGESPIVAMLTRDLTFKLSFLATFMIGLVNT